MEKLSILKIGGNVIDDPKQLKGFITQFIEIEGSKILVHGGGKMATAISKQMNIPVQLINGRRVTDQHTLDIAIQVYAGLINKKLVAKLQAHQCNAIGLSGADMNIIPAYKRKVGKVDYGFVGDFKFKKINTEHLTLLLKNGVSPVFCSITHDDCGQLLNTNADTIASGLAAALSPYYEVCLSFCFDKKGVLSDVNDDDSFLPQLNWITYLQLKKSGKIHSGMIPKLENAFFAKNNGVKKVEVKHSSQATKQDGTTFEI